MEIGGNSSFIKQVGKTITEGKVLLKTLAYSSPLFAKKALSPPFKILFSTTVTTANIFSCSPQLFFVVSGSLPL